MGIVDDTLGTNIFGSNSTDKALDAQKRAAGQASQTQMDMYNQSREDQMPWMQGGSAAFNTLLGRSGVGGGVDVPGGTTDKMRTQGGPSGGGGDLMRSFSMADFEADPGYQFRLAEGNKAIERSAAARGGLNSGGTMKALMGYGQNLASQEYQNAYNRYNNNQSNQFNRLASLAGVGQASSSQMANQSNALGNSLAETQMGLGNAQGAAYMAQANRGTQLIGMGLGAGAALSNPAAFSDERLKTNVTNIKESDLSEFRKTVKPYFFEYKDEKHGEGEWAGVMAQDLEKSKLGRMAVFEDENGHKKVHLNKLLSLLVASHLKGAS